MQYFFKLKNYNIPQTYTQKVKCITSLSIHYPHSIRALVCSNQELCLNLFNTASKIFIFKTLNLLNLKGSLVLKKWSHTRYFFLGLGYKVYTRSNTLFIWVGLTHYTLISFPKNIFIFAKKRRMYIMGTEENKFKTLLANVKRAKKKDIYKGKGLLEVKTYKNFIRMKTGKKKQY